MLNSEEFNSIRERKGVGGALFAKWQRRLGEVHDIRTLVDEGQHFLASGVIPWRYHTLDRFFARSSRTIINAIIYSYTISRCFTNL